MKTIPAIAILVMASVLTDLTTVNNFFAGTPARVSDLGFAHVLATDSAISIGTIGGSGTTGVDVVREPAGYYDVTFTGHYPATIAANKIVLFSSSASNAYQAGGNVVLSANASKIVVRVFAWESDAAVNEGDSFDVRVLLVG